MTTQTPVPVYALHERLPHRPLPRPSVVRPSVVRRLACPGLARLLLGVLLVFGAAGGLDQTPLAQAQASVNVLGLGALLVGWGVLRMERGSTVDVLRGIRNRFQARLYLRRVRVHQRRIGVSQ